MPESRRAGRLSGGKGPPLASTKRCPPSSPKRALLQETGSHTAARFLFSGGIMTSFGGVLSVGGQCAGRLMRRSRGETGFVRKRFFGGGRPDGGSLPPVRSCLPLGGQGGCPSSEDGDPPYRPEEKFFRGGEERERGRGSFYQKTPLPPLVMISLETAAYFKPRSRSRLLTAMWPMVATAPLVEDEQWEPMTRLSRAYQRASCGGSCSNTSRPAP